MLARMEGLTLDVMRSITRAQGFEWTDAELEAIRPAVEVSLRLLRRLETVPLDAMDPMTQYRIL